MPAYVSVPIAGGYLKLDLDDNIVAFRRCIGEEWQAVEQGDDVDRLSEALNDAL